MISQQVNNDAILELENKFYISTNSSYADNHILILNRSDTFGIFDRWGDVIPFGEAVQGVYHEGTRFLSECEFRVNGMRPLLLSSAVKELNDMLSVDLTTEAFHDDEQFQPILKGTVHIARSKFISNGSLHEKIEFMNYGGVKYEFNISLSFRNDFKDIFEIRGIRREKRGEIFESRHLPGNKFRIRYRGLDSIERATHITLSQEPFSWEGVDKAIFKVSLEPHQRYILEYSAVFQVGQTTPNSLGFDEAKTSLEEELWQTKKEFADVFTANEQFNNWINRSQADLISLLAITKEGRYPYAGVPWYNTAFGRDGIITALETLWINPAIARDVLFFLARKQATEVNAFQASEPGKILHEMRGGEMVELGEVPFRQYYGTVDATPLFIMLAGAYYHRTADIETIRAIWKNIMAALSWIDEYGDLDSDGFVEYGSGSETGLVNQGWKDSHDSISDEEGRLRPPPITLCEVQGYVYAAKLYASILANEMGEKELSHLLRKDAGELRKRFHAAFWDEELETYVLALDAEKKPCRISSSNAGHCLYTGIADPEVAQHLVNNLMSDDMFSGWGIRTLSSREKRFNPMSYHNGSVWPHDVAMIASGFARYGFRKEAMQLTGALFDSSLFIDLQRLPELFCGFTRRRGEGPTAYPVACSPQAWSVGAVFMLIESCLHMEINALERKVIFHKPSLPAFLDNILITDLNLGGKFVTFEIHRYKDRVGLDVKENTTDWEIIVVR